MTRTIAFMALMLVLVVIVNALEGVFLSPLMPPGMKPGLSNIFVMFVAITIGRAALGLSALKSLFVLLMRGPLAGLFSAVGGLLSVVAVLLLLKIFGKRISYVALGIIGATMHNAGQFFVAMAMLQMSALVHYLPVLILGAVITGAISGFLLGALYPALKFTGYGKNVS